ncbi:bifunctional serine/threonine-protein kinase/ABC transporter substrate-binding protein [Streptomyces sp. YIM 98790]|uniref:bifunctional serine/threonine-protein kinase/ABC transporter substrate-binding protein n=1 Tax=Streptomyces sp. YIM 98790 TaxID=2689077 RepID=UPI00140E53BE|nr:bifunctional serine/threonine-protein kinase/ABC transporter substrate-binding protein [Streptomyces sp. YIM 98790]
MEALKPSDPAWIGGHRLLHRLGAGGMGVVYLARSPGGALVALKLVRSEFADEPGFRRRFRREVEVAARLRGRWLVPVTAADPQAPEPWLATAYVPAPSLAEVLAGYGPLPERTVGVLGLRLAEALAEVHAAGLVHRDVKPGNVLLALDGPRLIDFGIARPVGATPLTATGTVVGSPGYLSPEQARARPAEIGPAGDIFSLGCVLAHAVTGRRPFGTGNASAVLYRTVHGEPDLAGVPGALLPLLRACLAKDAAGRPSATGLRHRLAAGPAAGAVEGERARPAPEVPDGPAGLHGAPTLPAAAGTGTGTGGQQDGGAGGAGGDGDWLPPELPRLIAERSARALDLPAPERTETGPAPTGPDTGRPSRRRLLAGLGTAGLVALGGGAAALLAADGSGAPPSPPPGTAPSATGDRPRRVIGLHADLTGAAGADGTAQERGARLAVEEHNSRPDRAFDLALEVYDDRGDPERAASAAARFTDTAEPAVAVVGPTTDAAAVAAVPGYQEAELPLAAVSVAVADLSAVTYSVYFCLRPTGDAYSAALVSYLSRAEPSTRIAVFEDTTAAHEIRSIATSLAVTPPADAEVTVYPAGDGEGVFEALAGTVLAGGADAVVFAGETPERAAACARALAAAGHTGPRLALEPVLAGGRFLAEAGAAAERWVVATGYTDPAEHPGAEEFTAAYRERHGDGPVPRFAAEAYDAVNFVAGALADLPAEGDLRDSLRRRLRRHIHRGITRRIAFQQTTRAFDISQGLFLHRVGGGRVRLLGAYDDAGPAWAP